MVFYNKYESINSFENNNSNRTVGESDTIYLSNSEVDNISPLSCERNTVRSDMWYNDKMSHKNYGHLNKEYLRNIGVYCGNKKHVNDSNDTDPRLHALKEVVPPNHQTEVYFSLRALQSRFDSSNHRNVEMGRGKVSNTFAKTAREQTMAKNIIESPKELDIFLTTSKKLMRLAWNVLHHSSC